MKTHRSAVVLIPPLEVWPTIQGIRRRYDRQFRRWMPHVTLLYPFRPFEEFEEAAERLSKALLGVEPFELELATFHHFEHNTRTFTLWLAPQPAEPLVDLQARLVREFPDCNEVNLHSTGFLPHLSVGQARTREELEVRLALLQTRFRPIRFVATEIALIHRGPGHRDRFEVESLIPFQV